jgi:hypothetical protein
MFRGPTMSIASASTYSSSVVVVVMVVTEPQ